MRLEWLEYFSDTALLGSIKAAAEKHNISPQGLSKCIRSLEAKLGVKLFERDANSVRLTPEGARLLDQAQKAIEAAQELVRQAREISSGDAKAPLAVMCSTFVFLCGMMAPLREGVTTAGRSATFTQLKTSELFDALAGKADLLHEGRTLCGVTILFDPVREQNEAALRRASLNGYGYLPILSYNDGALVASGHPLATHESVARSDLLDFPVVSSSIEQLAPLSAYLGAERISTAISDLATRLHVIQDGESVMFMPPFSDVVRDERYRFLPIDDSYGVEVGFVYDRAELAADELETILAPTFAAFSAFEDAGLCTISPAR